METFCSVMTVHSELIMIKLISSWTAQKIASLFQKSRRKKKEVKVINKALKVQTVKQTWIFSKGWQYLLSNCSKGFFGNHAFSLGNKWITRYVFFPDSKETSPQQRENGYLNYMEPGIDVILIWGKQIRTITDMLIKNDRSRRRPRRSWRLQWKKYIDKYFGESL